VTKDPRRLFSISRRRLYRWHGWLGLNLGLLLFVVCLSGTLAVVAYEIDWLLDPALRVEAATTEVDWTAVEQTVRETFPYHEIGFVLAPRHPGFAATVLARGPGGRWQKIYLHPQTGALQEAASYWNVQRFLRSFHRRMFLPNPVGIVWVTAFAFVLLFSVLSGILFFKRWHRHLLRVRWGDRRLRYADLHRLAGVWSLPFVSVWVVTGLWYGVELVAPATPPTPSAISDAQARERGPTPVMLPLGEQVRKAQQAFSGLRASEVIPGSPWEPTIVQGQAQAIWVRPRANAVRVDPVNGRVLSVQRATQIGAYHRWAETADPLHFGTFGGLWTQALWLVLGLVLSSSMLTGAWLWYRRTERKARQAGASPSSRWSPLASVAPVAVLILSAGYGARELDLYQRYGSGAHAERLARIALGPWRAELVQRGPIESGAELELDVYLFADEGTPNPRRATARLHCDECSPPTTTQGVGASRPLSFSLRLPDSGNLDSLSVALRVEAGDRSYEALAPLDVQQASKGERIDDGPPPVPGSIWTALFLFGTGLLLVVGGWLRLGARASALLRAPDTSHDA